MKKSKKAVGSALVVREIREGLGLSQHELAGLFSCSWASVSKWETQERTPGGALLLLLRVCQRAYEKHGCDLSYQAPGNMSVRRRLFSRGPARTLRYLFNVAFDEEGDDV